MTLDKEEKTIVLNLTRALLHIQSNKQLDYTYTPYGQKLHKPSELLLDGQYSGEDLARRYYDKFALMVIDRQLEEYHTKY